MQLSVNPFQQSSTFNARNKFLKLTLSVVSLEINFKSLLAHISGIFIEDVR